MHWRHDKVVSKGWIKDKRGLHDKFEGTHPKIQVASEWLFEWVGPGTGAAVIFEHITPYGAALEAYNLSK